MSLGKTPQAITAARLVKAERVLVIGPLATSIGWAREAATWAGIPAMPRIERREPVPAGPCWAFLPWTDLATRYKDIMNAPRWDVIICDEVHRAKAGRASAVGRACWGDNGGRGRPAAARHGDRLWCLSGTPTPNGRPVELLGMLTAIGHPVAQDRRQYINRYCRRPNPFHPQGWDDQGAMNLQELRDILRRDVMLRRLPEDVPGELPDIRRQVVELPDAGGDTVWGKAQDRKSLPPLEEMSAYRAELGTRKMPAVARWVTDFVTDGGTRGKDKLRPIVVFVHHKESARMIAERLGSLASIIATGDDSPEARQAKVDAFAQPDGPAVFIGTTPACGTGMNGLHRRTATCAFAEGEWSPADIDQAEGRIRRIGGVGGSEALSIAYYLAVADSLEAHIMRVLAAKRDRIDEMTNAQKPLNYEQFFAWLDS